MARLLVTQERREGVRTHFLRKKLTVLGGDPGHDVELSGARGAVLQILEEGGRYFAVPVQRAKINGQALRGRHELRPCDRLEWSGGAAVFLGAALVSEGRGEGERALNALQLLQDLASAPLRAGLQRTLELLVDLSGAEVGCMLSEVGERDGAWRILARTGGPENLPDRRTLLSHTILKEALEKRAPVHIESIVGHPLADAASVIEARIFSVACLPLIVEGRVFGAAFVYTRTPGRAIRRERLGELGLFASQAALLLAARSEAGELRRENSRLKRSASGDGVVRGEGSPIEPVLAREIHRRSPRAPGPFVAVNCAAIPEALLESTLFGHERGAFTGAVKAQVGRFVQADGGTFLLDEVGDLPLELQAKLLRVLQEGVVEPLGASRPVRVDVRVLAATHRDLEQLVRAGRFRQDLYFRLNGVTLRIPPLRARREDILPLARHFLEATSVDARLTAEAEERLLAHSWPGNVRELEQVIRRAAFLCEGGRIRCEDLELSAAGRAPPEPEGFGAGLSLKEAQEEFTQQFVLRALEKAGGNRQAAAYRLGISERTLYRLLAAAEGART